MKTETKPTTGVLTLARLIAYQAGSIVSRTLVERPSGTVTLFAFDRGQGLSEHTAPFTALVQIVEGEAEITLSGKKNRVAAGRAIIMPAGAPHALRAEKRFKMMLTMIRS